MMGPGPGPRTRTMFGPRLGLGPGPGPRLGPGPGPWKRMGQGLVIRKHIYFVDDVFLFEIATIP